LAVEREQSRKVDLSPGFRLEIVCLSNDDDFGDKAMSGRWVAGLMAAAGLICVGAGCSGSDDVQQVDNSVTGSGRTQVIFDYSPTLSDVTTLMYLTQHPDVDLLAVTLAGTGESHCEEGVANTVALLELVGQPEVPVACGRTTPIGPGNSWPPEWRERSDALVGLDLTTGTPELSLDAADLIADIAAESSGPVTILAVGPLTNLAVALEEHDDLAENVSVIYTMGGALDVAGNAPNQSAEWNYFIDPTAVEAVLESAIPVTVVPLDATNYVPVTRDWFVKLTTHNTTPAATVVHDLLAATPAWDLGFDFWDELTAAAMLDPTLVTYEDRNVSVVTAGEAAGSIENDSDGASVRVALAADAERFERELLIGLNAGALPTRATAATPQEVAYFEAVGESAASLDTGIEELFQSPEAIAVENLVDGGPTEMTAEQEQQIRVFFRSFWSGAMDLADVHVAELAALDVPESVRQTHEAYVAAFQALIADEDNQLSTLDGLQGEALQGFLFGTNTLLEMVDENCANLEQEALIRGLDAQLCSN
jgi:inosine-uridine nucleoside N-ribohydrolase